MNNIFFTPGELMQRHIRAVVVGCGGTGSEVISGLARLHYAMTATGHPSGLFVVALDGDTVSPSNIGRQPFSLVDVGQYKSIALIQRYNLHYGLRWEARPYHFETNRQLSNTDFDLLITCVDKASVRVKIAKFFCNSHRHRHVLWLDAGNDAHSAQVILGHLTSLPPEEGSLRLPNVFDLYPELEKVNDDAAPSCSVAEALRSQDLMVNRITADCGIQIINALLRHGKLDYHGAFIDVSRLTVQPLKIDPTMWASMGYSPENSRQSTRKH